MSRFFGGRKEVLDMPLAEAFVYMDLHMKDLHQEAERKRQLFWMDFLSKVYSQTPPQGKGQEEFIQARHRFIAAIQPEGMPQKEYKWNIPPEVIEEAERRRIEQESGEFATVEVEKGGN